MIYYKPTFQGSYAAPRSLSLEADSVCPSLGLDNTTSINPTVGNPQAPLMPCEQPGPSLGLAQVFV